ncbi:ras-GEF domain-containing family member 1B-like isoform X4 [Cloeon dipterum]|uniref:ras-GEF domain-containing family member 1B-like isoform X4 n=1 Tax=Cloeon dipterum TaxID=197152 RepID=UPI00321FA7F4
MAMYYYATRWFSERSLAPPPRRHRSRQPHGQPPPLPQQSAASTPPPSSPRQQQQPQPPPPPVAKQQTKQAKKSEAAASSSSSRGSESPQPPTCENQQQQQQQAPIYEQANGPLEPLLAKMVPKDDYFPDRAFLFAFLLSARLFVQPHELLRRLSRLCEPKLQNGCSAGHWVRLLAEWTAAFPYDFRDERVMAEVREMTQRCVAQEPQRRVQVSLLLEKLLERLTAAEQYEQFVHKSASSKVDSLKDLHLAELTAASGSPARMAAALAVLELERLSFVGPEEFVQAFAREANLHSSLREAKRTSTNLENYADWFDRLAALVATHVLKHSQAGDRTKEIEFWTSVAKESVRIGNLNSAMAVVAAFDAISHDKLTDTWSQAQIEELADLRRLSTDDGFYKATLAAAAAKAKKERLAVVVPCFSVLLKELFALNRSCCDRLPNGQVNFDTFTELAEKMSELMVWTRAKCPFEKDQGLALLLQTSPVLSPKGLEEASSVLERDGGK